MVWRIILFNFKLIKLFKNRFLSKRLLLRLEICQIKLYNRYVALHNFIYDTEESVTRPIRWSWRRLDILWCIWLAALVVLVCTPIPYLKYLSGSVMFCTTAFKFYQEALRLKPFWELYADKIDLTFRAVWYSYFFQKLLLTVDFIREFTLIEVPSFLLMIFAKDIILYFDVFSMLFCMIFCNSRVETGLEPDTRLLPEDRQQWVRDRQHFFRKRDEKNDSKSKSIFRMGKFELRVFCDDCWPFCHGYLVRWHYHRTDLAFDYMAKYSTYAIYSFHITDFQLKNVLCGIWVVQSCLTALSLLISFHVGGTDLVPSFLDRSWAMTWVLAGMYLIAKCSVLLLFNLYQDLWSEDRPTYIRGLQQYLHFNLVFTWVLFKYFLTFVTHWWVLQGLLRLTLDIALNYWGIATPLELEYSQTYNFYLVTFATLWQRKVVADVELRKELRLYHDDAVSVWLCLERFFLFVTLSFWPGCYWFKLTPDLVGAILFCMSWFFTHLFFFKWVGLCWRAKDWETRRRLKIYTYCPPHWDYPEIKRYKEFSFRNLLTILIVRFWLDIGLWFFALGPYLIFVWFFDYPSFWYTLTPLLATFKKFIFYIYFTDFFTRVGDLIRHERGLPVRVLWFCLPVIFFFVVLFTNFLFLL